MDTLRRLKEFSRLRARGREAEVIHGDSREVPLHGRFDGVITSPPYPGLIDYHEQHRYAYELLGLEDQVADGEHQPVLVDHDAAAFADSVVAQPDRHLIARVA